MNIQSIEDAMKYRIGTVREDAAEQILLSQGFDENNIQKNNMHRYNIEKLNLGRIDMIAFDEQGYKDFIRSGAIPPQTTEVVWLIKEIQLFYAFHRDTSDEVIRAFQDALDSLDSERQTIINKYLQ